MCRRTAAVTFADLGNSTKLRLFDSMSDVREMADIDEDTFAVVMRIIFAGNAEPLLDLPVINTYQAAVMLEVMKDFLYQAYVRKGRLQQAMKVRKFFVEEAPRAAGGKRPLVHPLPRVAEHAVPAAVLARAIRRQEFCA